MSFLDEIRRQPRHHREIMFGLCVVTTVSLVGMVWFNSFEKNLYVLLNPEESADNRFLAENEESKAALSLFGSISQTGKELKATFLGIFSSIGGSAFGGNLAGDDKKEIIIDDMKVNDSGKVYTLPLSEKK